MTTLGVGLMSGTSLDGIDAALVRIEGPDDLHLVAFRTDAFDATQRGEILRTIERGRVRDLALLHVFLGERFASATMALLDTAGVTPRDIAFVACHGQTVWHEPGRVSLQLGDPAVIAEQVGVQVVSDFRSRDVAAGGQGAPLVPVADASLFGHPERGRGLLNIGGMANVTWVPRKGVHDGVIAFDTGPGVAVIDAVVRSLAPGMPFDTDGRLAASGTPVTSVVESALAASFFAESPPKSTGREQFGDAFAADLVQRIRGTHAAATPGDCVATAVAITATSIARACTRWLPSHEPRELVVSGGGGKNPTLMAYLEAELRSWEIRRFEDEFFDGDAKEAAAFAYLGWLAINGRPGNIPQVTGAAGSRVLGRITPP